MLVTMAIGSLRVNSHLSSETQSEGKGHPSHQSLIFFFFYLCYSEFCCGMFRYVAFKTFYCMIVYLYVCIMTVLQPKQLPSWGI